MAIDTSKFAMQEVFDVNVFDLSDGACLAILDDLKTSTWSNNGETVYTQGGKGNPKIIGFGHSKESMLECGSAVISDGLLGVQSGSDVTTETNATAVQYQEVLTVTSDAATSTYTATGTAGEEIGYVYVVNSDGSLGAQLTQAGAVAAGEFTYTAGTKAFAFDTAELADGTKIMVFYYPTVASAKRVQNVTSEFAKNVKVVANGRFRDTCTGKDYNAQLVFHKAKTSEEYSFDLAADGEPVVQNVSFEALKSCDSDNLWDLYIYDTEDLS